MYYGANRKLTKLVVVDEKGTARIVIGAPVPDPQIRGSRSKRRSPASGIQVNDAKGNERVGLALLDDGTTVVGMDDELGRERNHLFFIPNRGAGLLVQGEKGGVQISLLIPFEGQQSGAPKLEMVDESGKTTVALPGPK
jgi:hypothetical protein